MKNIVSKLKSKAFWTGAGIAITAGAVGVAGAIIYGKVTKDDNENYTREEIENEENEIIEEVEEVIKNEENEEIKEEA